MVSARAEGSGKRIRTGVAITAGELCAADIRLRDSADRSWRAPLDAPPQDGGDWPSLTAALTDLARRLGVAHGTLVVSLLPPLTEVRRLELPPLRDDEIQRVLSRQASRYFVAAKTPQIVGAKVAGRRARNAPVSVVAAAAPARLITAIRGSAALAGWTIETIEPAEGAWTAAAVSLWPSFARQTAHVLVAHDDRTDLLHVDEGRLAGVRRFRGGAADAPMIVDSLGPAARVGILGSVGSRKELAAALGALGLSAVPPTGDSAAAGDRPDLLAARFSGGDTGPVLRGEEAIRAEAARTRRAAWSVAGAAAALFIASALIELWGVHRELDRVRAERARIRPEISSTMVGRTTVDAAYRHLATLGTIERTSPRWSAVIASLTDALPDDAHLLALRTRDDSVVVDGVADHAARVFDALEKADGLTGVRAAAAGRREIQEGGADALEHFVIAARVVPRTRSVVVAPAANTSTPRPAP